MSEFFTNYKRPPNVRTLNKSPSKTCQQFKDEADINNLVARYNKTGSFYNALDCAGRVARMPQFADFAELGDFREQQETLLRVYDSFASLPSRIRERFSNNPAFFVEFVGNAKNFDECVKLGIFDAPVVQVSEPDAVAPDAVAPVVQPIVGDGTAIKNPLS